MRSGGFLRSPPRCYRPQGPAIGKLPLPSLAGIALWNKGWCSANGNTRASHSPFTIRMCSLHSSVEMIRAGQQ
jgi:hypothetical protein